MDVAVISVNLRGMSGANGPRTFSLPPRLAIPPPGDGEVDMVEDVSLRPRLFRFRGNLRAKMLQVLFPCFADSHVLAVLGCLPSFVRCLLLGLMFPRIDAAVDKRLETSCSLLRLVDSPTPRIADCDPHRRAMDLPLEDVSLGSASGGTQTEPGVLLSQRNDCDLPSAQRCASTRAAVKFTFAT